MHCISRERPISYLSNERWSPRIKPSTIWSGARTNAPTEQSSSAVVSYLLTSIIYDISAPSISRLTASLNGPDQSDGKDPWTGWFCTAIDDPSFFHLDGIAVFKDMRGNDSQKRMLEKTLGGIPWPRRRYQSIFSVMHVFFSLIQFDSCRPNIQWTFLLWKEHKIQRSSDVGKDDEEFFNYIIFWDLVVSTMP